LFNKGGTKIPVELDYLDALSDFCKVIELNPSFKNIYKERVEVKYNLEDFRGAIIDLNRAIEFDSKDGRTFYLRGLSKLFLNQKDSGCLDLSKAGELGYKAAYFDIKRWCN